MRTSRSVPSAEAVTGSDEQFAGLVEPAAARRFPVLLVTGHKRDPKIPRRAGKPWQQQRQAEDPICTLPRDAAAVLSPCHLSPSSLSSLCWELPLGESLLLSLPWAGHRDVPSSQTLSRESFPAFPFWGFSSSRPSRSSCLHCWCAAGSCLPSPLPFVPAAEPCSLPLDEGDCQRYTLRWYYNQRVTECRPFVYSGCRGNLNRFDSKEECELHCRQHPGPGRHGMAQPLAPAGPAASPTGAVGSANAEPGGRCCPPALALTPPHFSPQMPMALLEARCMGSRRCRRGQCLGRQGCPAVGGSGCQPGRGWTARGGRDSMPASPRQELGAISNTSYCCSRVFPFISVLWPVKVKFVSNGKPSSPATKLSTPVPTPRFPGLFPV